MNFRKWLAQNYKATLSGVPQDLHHHPEGDVLAHVRLVRKAIPRAIQELKALQQDPKIGPVLSDIDFTLSPQEAQIVILSSWLHDIGKVTATKIDNGKITAVGHQDPEHYGPQIEKMLPFAPPETKQLYLHHQQLVDFLIQHHMDFTSGGFAKDFISQYFRNGKALNVPEIKLLLILMWADRLGRARPEQLLMQALGKAAGQLANSAERGRVRDLNIQNQSKPFAGSPAEFAQMLAGKPMSLSQKISALKGKFPSLSDEEAASLCNG